MQAGDIRRPARGRIGAFGVSQREVRRVNERERGSIIRCARCEGPTVQCVFED